MKLIIVDYGAGNLQSVANALRTAGAEGVIVTADPNVVRAADRVVLPGVQVLFAFLLGVVARLVENLSGCRNQRGFQRRAAEVKADEDGFVGGKCCHKTDARFAKGMPVQK